MANLINMAFFLPPAPMGRLVLPDGGTAHTRSCECISAHSVTLIR